MSTKIQRQRSYGRSVSVVIPVWNEVELTRACLASLARGREEHGLPQELILVDNGSSDATPSWLAEIVSTTPWIRSVSFPENRGFAAGCNAGLRVAQGDWVTFLNNDTLVSTQLLPRLLRAALRQPRVGLVAPCSNYVKGRQRIEIFGNEQAEDVEGVQRRLVQDFDDRVEDVNCLAGLCLLAERKLLENLGGFDERFGLGNYEDDDLILRIRLRGLRLLIARDAYLFHHGNRTFKALGINYEEQLQENRLHFDQKWHEQALFTVEKALTRGNTAEAKSILNSGAELPSAARAHACARVAEQEQRFTDAATHWRQYLQEAPFDSEAHCHLALCHIKEGDESGGRIRLAEVLRVHCYDSLVAASVLTQLAEHELEQGRHQLACADVEDALAIREDFVPAINLRAVLDLAAERPSEALARLEPWLDRQDECLHANAGIALHQLGRQDEALAAFRRGVELGEPNCASARNLRQLETALGL